MSKISARQPCVCIHQHDFTCRLCYFKLIAAHVTFALEQQQIFVNIQCWSESEEKLIFMTFRGALCVCNFCINY